MRIATGILVGILMGGASLASAAGESKTLRGSVAPIVKSTKPVGPTSPTESFTVSIYLKTRNPAAMRKLDKELGQPGFVPLTQAQWQAKFAPTQAQVNAVSAWAKSQNLTVTQASTTEGSVDVSGSTKQMESAFAVRINDYKISNGPVSGTFRSNANNPSVPRALPIKAVFGFDNIPVVQPLEGAK